MDTSLPARVARGLARLDAKYPTWREKVNLDTLDMHSASVGVLEQVFGRYNVGLQMLDLRYSSAVDFGFDIDADEDHEVEVNAARWRSLTDAWKEALQPEGRAHGRTGRTLPDDGTRHRHS